jgi:alpha-amylase/alpha-mannosidase (GH57 family)
MRSVVVHGHFYQPPRENPWTDEVEPEPTAAPFPDWNARITHECYEPFGSARILDASGHITGRLNLYEWVSFNVGSTLAHWMDSHAPDVSTTILDADRASALRLNGHGNAIAMPYHHLILPLASRRDKVTEVRWGLADFRRRFGRDAEGMWLPETAVDEETLVVLAEAGVRFTILAPHQVANPSPNGEPLRFSAGGGRQIAVFTYDGGIAADAAFGRLLDDSHELARRLVPRGEVGDETVRITSLAIDGETFGHHHKFGEMALAGAISLMRSEPGLTIENYASLLSRVPPRVEAQLIEPSSWSCPHGVERWRSGCTCGVSPTAMHEWRRPLRAALNWLARELDARADPGATTPAIPSARFGMFGSCAWFFDDVAGHETVLMLRLAAYAIATLGDDALEKELLDRLALAKSGDASEGDAAQVYRKRVVPLRPQRAA